MFLKQKVFKVYERDKLFLASRYCLQLKIISSN